MNKKLTISQLTINNIVIISTLLLIVSLLIVNWALPSHAWVITPELKQEVAQKQAAVLKNPDDPYAHFDLAITYAYANRIQEGWKELTKVEKLDPNFRKTGLKDYIGKVIENPNDWRLRFRLAFAYYFNNDKEQAARELKNVLVLQPYNVWAYGYLALVYGDLGDVDLAMEYAKKGLAIDDNVAALHLLLSEGYYKKGDSWNGFRERVEAIRLRALGY